MLYLNVTDVAKVAGYCSFGQNIDDIRKEIYERNQLKIKKELNESIKTQFILSFVPTAFIDYNQSDTDSFDSVVDYVCEPFIQNPERTRYTV